MWHYVKDEEVTGPITEEEVEKLIAAGVLSETTLVWRKGMESWDEAQATALNRFFVAPSLTLSPLPDVSSPAFDDPGARSAVIPGDFRDPVRLTQWLTRLLIAGIALSVIALWSGFLEYDLLQEAQEGLIPSDADAEANDVRQAVVGLFQVLVFIVTGVVFLRWIYRANKNARQLGAKGMQFTPGWSVGWYFVPIANLWKPYQAMKEIWNASVDPLKWDAQGRSPILGLWWALWLLSSFLGNLSFRLAVQAETIAELISANAVTLVSDALDIPLLWVAVVLVRRIFEMQRAALRGEPH